MGGLISSAEIIVLVGISVFYGLLAINLFYQKKWAYWTTLIFLSLMSITSILKLSKGLSHPSPGYLAFLVTYLVIVCLLLLPSTRNQFK